MKDSKQNPNLRILIIANLVALSYIVLSWELFQDNHTDTLVLIAQGMSLATLLITYYAAFWHTGLWKYTHRKVDQLDERELAENDRALRFAYSSFTVLVLALLLIYVLADISLTIIPVVSLIYLAHILPAVYLGWRNHSPNARAQAS